MKKILCSAIILSLVLASCSNQNVSVADETLSQTVAVRAAGTTFTPDAALPAGETLTWSSSNEAIAEVNNGVVTAIIPGTTEIVATTANGKVVKTIDLTVPIGCNLNTPGWGSNLGTVSFATDQTWIVGSLTWSDAVQTTNCSRQENYHGGHWGLQDFNADCRSNVGQKGDLFTWCAIIRYQDELCPYPWRVPTQQDFIDLDKALGGDSENKTDVALRDLYFSKWGAGFGGYCSPTGTRGVQDSWAFYWSLTQAGPTTGFMLALNDVGFVGPRRDSVKYRGFSLRCVRNTE